MKLVKSAAIVALLVGALASPASATSLVRVDYTGGSTAQAGSGGSSIEANVSDMLSFDVSVDVDSSEMTAISFGLRWQDAAELTLVAADWETGAKLTSFAPTTQILLLSPYPAALRGGVGEINDIGFINAAPIAPWVSSTNVFLGTVVFHVQAATVLGSSIMSGFFDPNSAVSQDGSLALITPDFAAGFNIHAGSGLNANPIPEPGASALIGLGLLGLALASRRTP